MVKDHSDERVSIAAVNDYIFSKKSIDLKKSRKQSMPANMSNVVNIDSEIKYRIYKSALHKWSTMSWAFWPVLRSTPLYCNTRGCRKKSI